MHQAGAINQCGLFIVLRDGIEIGFHNPQRQREEPRRVDEDDTKVCIDQVEVAHYPVKRDQCGVHRERQRGDGDIKDRALEAEPHTCERVGADNGDGEREDGRDGESGIFDQHARAEAEVAKEGLHAGIIGRGRRRLSC